VATTGMVADSVRNVGAKHVKVTALMGPGTDPHLYKANERDIRLISGADMVFISGLHLEGKLGDVLRAAGKAKPVIAVADILDTATLREPPGNPGAHDPHVWFDVSMWASTLDAVKDALVRQDPEHAADYERNAETYRTQLRELHEWCRQTISTIPESGRVMITAHDAFGYFGRAYAIEVRGIQGISTESEAGVREINDLVDLIVSRGVKAVFVESSVPRKNIEALIEGAKARGGDVRVGGELFSDAMGAEGTPEGTYIGMVRHNVETIVNALR
jgi:manganese/zinc/iron transport system substrate-binding protein